MDGSADWTLCQYNKLGVLSDFLILHEFMRTDVFFINCYIGCSSKKCYYIFPEVKYFFKYIFLFPITDTEQ